MSSFKYICIDLLLIGFSSCDIKENEATDGDSFTTVLNENDYGRQFAPVAIASIPDSSYIILSAVEGWHTHVTRVDARGQYISQATSEELVNPLGEILFIDGEPHFIAMNLATLAAQLVKIEGTELTPVANYPNARYPLAVSSTADGGFILLAYDRDSRASKVVKVGPSGSVQWEEAYDVKEDVEKQVFDHVSYLGERLPFFVGEGNGVYFFNGFANYTLTFAQIGKSDGAVLDSISGFQNTAAISAAMSVSGNNYAMARYVDFDNYIVSLKNIGGIPQTTQLGGTLQPEMVPKAPVLIKKVTLNDKDYTFYASNSKSGQLVIYAYEPSGAFLNMKSFGGTNDVRMASMTQAPDGTLVILGSTDVAGRFSRLMVIKLSEEELQEIIQPI